MEFKRARIVACMPHEGYRIWIRFDDGISGEVDLSHLAGKGIFQAWNSLEFFNSVYVDKKTETVAWNNDLDLDPYVLREEILKQQAI